MASSSPRAAGESLIHLLRHLLPLLLPPPWCSQALSPSFPPHSSLPVQHFALCLRARPAGTTLRCWPAGTSTLPRTPRTSFQRALVKSARLPRRGLTVRPRSSGWGRTGEQRGETPTGPGCPWSFLMQGLREDKHSRGTGFKTIVRSAFFTHTQENPKWKTAGC